MYRHFLVPIDGTDLSIEAVGNAVGLARAVGAHITFFHVIVADTEPLRGAAEALRFAPQNARAFTASAGELLAKAEAAARAFGVPCDSKCAVNDQPAAAIVEAARGMGCDLVFMASHGPHQGEGGAAAASTTMGVVLNAGLPVLVSSAGDLGPSARAIGMIRDEHRSLAAVLHAWMQALATARSAGTAADLKLMRAIVCYIEVLPLALHEPKEEEHLFRRLRERTSTVNAELDELQRQHARDRQRVAELAALVATLAAVDGEAAVSATRELDDAVRSYASFVWEHLGREEGVILPSAQRHLTEADWWAIDAAFMKSSEPGLDNDAGNEARQLFSFIVQAAGGLQEHAR
jgi:nucleotide-binding universal stress UspA family protein/hemerythrin-like domain-containing protein